ncbi:hypothetical protein AMTR_s00024p00253400 [Amborella trichopoda]|uniref:Uncharacterized protein n=1 Tax=Amborella trichopoda TaxID=13333 RepID=W1PTI4_AMBTC|nr:hypothetical protein AMTR_s00024p00253400 [Amborella trichopoda]
MLRMSRERENAALQKTIANACLVPSVSNENLGNWSKTCAQKQALHVAAWYPFMASLINASMPSIIERLEIGGAGGTGNSFYSTPSMEMNNFFYGIEDGHVLHAS